MISNSRSIIIEVSLSLSQNNTAVHQLVARNFWRKSRLRIRRDIVHTIVPCPTQTNETTAACRRLLYRRIPSVKIYMEGGTNRKSPLRTTTTCRTATHNRNIKPFCRATAINMHFDQVWNAITVGVVDYWTHDQTTRPWEQMTGISGYTVPFAGVCKLQNTKAYFGSSKTENTVLCFSRG